MFQFLFPTVQNSRSIFIAHLMHCRKQQYCWHMLNTLQNAGMYQKIQLLSVVYPMCNANNAAILCSVKKMYRKMIQLIRTNYETSFKKERNCFVKCNKCVIKIYNLYFVECTKLFCTMYKTNLYNVQKNHECVRIFRTLYE